MCIPWRSLPVMKAHWRGFIILNCTVWPVFFLMNVFFALRGSYYSHLYEPCHEKNQRFAYAKTKTQISFAVTAKLISAFVFATRIVQSLFYLNPKFQASSHLLWLYSLVCVGPGQKPRRPVFSERGSYYLHLWWLHMLKQMIWVMSWENLSSGFPTRSDTNWALQLQKMARGMKFRISEVEWLYYLCSENKGADQLRSYCAADLRLCFRKFICKKQVFSWVLTRLILWRGLLNSDTFPGEDNVLYMVLVTGCLSVGKIGESEIFCITATQFVSLQNLPNDEERIVGVRNLFNSRTFYFAWSSSVVPWDLTLCAQRKLQDHDTDNRFFWWVKSTISFPNILTL